MASLTSTWSPRTVRAENSAVERESQPKGSLTHSAFMSRVRTPIMLCLQRLTLHRQAR